MNIEILKALVEFVANVRLMAYNHQIAQTTESDVENAAEILEGVLWREIEAAEHQMHLTDGGLAASDSESKPAAIGR